MVGEMLGKYILKREVYPTSGRVTVRLLSLLVVVAGTLGQQRGEFRTDKPIDKSSLSPSQVMLY